MKVLKILKSAGLKGYFLIYREGRDGGWYIKSY